MGGWVQVIVGMGKRTQIVRIKPRRGPFPSSLPQISAIPCVFIFLHFTIPCVSCLIEPIYLHPIDRSSPQYLSHHGETIVESSRQRRHPACLTPSVYQACNPEHAHQSRKPSQPQRNKAVPAQWKLLRPTPSHSELDRRRI